MAQTVQTTLIDDLDPDVEATGTVVFALDGAAYETHLSNEHTVALRAAVAPYAAAELDRRGAELLFQVLTEREETNSVAIASNERRAATQAPTDQAGVVRLPDQQSYQRRITLRTR